MSIHSIIREGRQRLGWSEVQFAEAVGVTRGAVQQWEKPNGTAPKRSTQPRVAHLLGISVADLLTGSNTGTPARLRAAVPLVTPGEAGCYPVVDNFNLSAGLEMVPCNVQVKRHTFALSVHGDSMISESHDSFPEGSILIVEPDMKAETGDYVIARNPEGETTFKQLVIDSGTVYLKPLNPRYPIRLLDKAEVIGVVREYRKKFR